MSTDEPTPGELSRRFDSLDRRLDQLAAAVGKLPTTELISAQQDRTGDRFGQLERDLVRNLAAIERLTLALEAEQEARRAADDKLEQALEEEGKARHAEINAEKGRVGTWVRWLLAGVVAAGGAALAQAFGLGHSG